MNNNNNEICYQWYDPYNYDASENNVDDINVSLKLKKD